MPNQIASSIIQYYDDAEVWQVIKGVAFIQQQFNDPAILNNQVCVVLPLVYRGPDFVQNQFNLYLFIKHKQVTELGQLELYQVIDFIRQKCMFFKLCIQPIWWQAQTLAYCWKASENKLSFYKNQKIWLYP